MPSPMRKNIRTAGQRASGKRAPMNSGKSLVRKLVTGGNKIPKSKIQNNTSERQRRANPVVWEGPGIFDYHTQLWMAKTGHFPTPLGRANENLSKANTAEKIQVQKKAQKQIQDEAKGGDVAMKEGNSEKERAEVFE